MKFMITFNHIDGEWDKLTPEQQEAHSGALLSLINDLKAEQDSDLTFLAPVAEAKTVRMHPDGHVAVTDGPYIESTEQPGGYYMIEAETIDEAVEWAKRGRFLIGSNEVRQILDA